MWHPSEKLSKDRVCLFFFFLMEASNNPSIKCTKICSNSRTLEKGCCLNPKVQQLGYRNKRVEGETQDRDPAENTSSLQWCPHLCPGLLLTIWRRSFRFPLLPNDQQATVSFTAKKIAPYADKSLRCSWTFSHQWVSAWSAHTGETSVHALPDVSSAC